MTRKDILESYPEEDFLFLDGFDSAILGVVREANHPIRVAYSVDIILTTLCEDMNLSDAWEYYGFNIEGAYVGEQTPILVDDLEGNPLPASSPDPSEPSEISSPPGSNSI